MNELEEFRKQIDALDAQLIDILARRFDVVRAVGTFKSGTDITVVQPARAQAVKNRAAEMGAERGLDPAFIHHLYEMMIDYAHEIEHDILDAANNKTKTAE